MAIEEVRKLVDRFESNIEKMSSIHRLLNTLQRQYQAFWDEMWKECERTHHDRVILEKEEKECDELSERKRVGELTASGDILRYEQLVKKLKKAKHGSGKSYYCPYCGKKLKEGHSFWESSFPQKIYVKEHLKSLLRIEPEEWPEEKRELLQKIKNGVGDYLNMVEPLHEKLIPLAEDQIEVRAQLNEIRAECDKALCHHSKNSKE